MKELHLVSVSPLGDNNPKYGQTYWGEADGSDLPVMFNSKQRVADNAKITYEEAEDKVSRKGKSYLRLKGVKVISEGFAPPTQSTATKPAGQAGDKTDKIIELLTETNRLLALLAGEEKTAQQPKEQTTEEAIEDIDDGGVDLSDIPF